MSFPVLFSPQIFLPFSCVKNTNLTCHFQAMTQPFPFGQFRAESTIITMTLDNNVVLGYNQTNPTPIPLHCFWAGTLPTHHSITLPFLHSDASPVNHGGHHLTTFQSTNHDNLPISQFSTHHLPYHHSQLPANQHYRSCLHLCQKIWQLLLTTAKQTHWLNDARVDDFLSKWTDKARASLVTLDVFAGFYYVSTTKKLCFLLETMALGEDIVVRTASNSASLSKFYCINTLAIGNLFAMIPTNVPTGLFPEGSNFSKTDNPKVGNFFPPNSDPLDKFKFVNFQPSSPSPMVQLQSKGISPTTALEMLSVTSLK